MVSNQPSSGAISRFIVSASNLKDAPIPVSISHDMLCDLSRAMDEWSEEELTWPGREHVVTRDDPRTHPFLSCYSAMSLYI